MTAAGCKSIDNEKSDEDWPWDQEQGRDPSSGPDADPENGKPRYVWIDASANFQYYANSIDNIKADVKRIK